MANPVYLSGSFKNLTATGTIPNSPKVAGFYVNSTSSGTLAFSDDNGAITGTITPAIGWHFLPVQATGTLTVTKGGTSINVTVCFS